MSVKLPGSDSKKRRYYSSASDYATRRYKMFLVRYHDLSEDSFLCDGPFGTREDADERVNEYLKKGICSWMVTYND